MAAQAVFVSVQIVIDMLDWLKKLLKQIRLPNESNMATVSNNQQHLCI